MSEKRIDKFDILLMAIRQAILIVLGAIEDYRGMKRTKEPKRRKRASGKGDDENE